MKLRSFFPPSPRSFRGRRGELRTLMGLLQSDRATRVALVGAGGSGKSTLACVLGHRLCRFFGGRVFWFRIGAWDARTIATMMALRFGVRSHGRDPFGDARQFLIDSGPSSLIVLDNHEDDRATAKVLEGLRDANASFVITARRLLLSGITLFPIAPALITTGKSPYPGIERLTRVLRWNPVALNLARALVDTGVTCERALEEWLISREIGRILPILHEDDIPEVGLLVERAWMTLSETARRMLGVLAHIGGDHIDAESLTLLSYEKGQSPAPEDAESALHRLRELCIVEEPLRGRYALHATVRHAVQKRTEPLPGRLFEHYVSLLERDPSRCEIEQGHLFAAMDYAQEKGHLQSILRVEKVASALASSVHTYG